MSRLDKLFVEERNIVNKYCNGKYIDICKYGETFMYEASLRKSSFDWDWANVPVSIISFFNGSISLAVALFALQGFGRYFLLAVSVVSFIISMFIWSYNSNAFGNCGFEDFFRKTEYYKRVSKRKAKKIKLQDIEEIKRQEVNKIRQEYINDLRKSLGRKI